MQSLHNQHQHNSYPTCAAFSHDCYDAGGNPCAASRMFDPKKTADIQHLAVQWSGTPVAKLMTLLGPGLRYGYIGTEDRTMYPLIMPGSIVQIDEQKKRIALGQWQNEFERPIYFLETHDGYTCCWCTRQAGVLILQPHPRSTEPARILRLGQDVEVIGQVVGIAMRLVVDLRQLVFESEENPGRSGAEREPEA